MITFKQITSGYYQCIEYPNYTIRKKNRIWLGYDIEKLTGSCICCSDNTLKKVKKIIADYITNGCWYK